MATVKVSLKGEQKRITDKDGAGIDPLEQSIDRVLDGKRPLPQLGKAGRFAIPNSETLKITMPNGELMDISAARSATLAMNPREPAILTIEFFAETE
jgi:hypothetical protein